MGRRHVANGPGGYAMQIKIMTTNFLVLIVGAFLLAGCGQEAAIGGAADDVPAASFGDVYAAAEKALAAAEARRNVWSKTEEMLSDAKAAFDNGEVEAAIELATEARLQAELAVTQAEFEEDAWRSRVLSK
jgi:hypothetical protein